jgi:hypothetical protein
VKEGKVWPGRSSVSVSPFTADSASAVLPVLNADDSCRIIRSGLFACERGGLDQHKCGALGESHLSFSSLFGAHERKLSLPQKVFLKVC